MPAPTTPKPRTRDDVEQLKRDWLESPSWDLTTAYGFEAHSEELAAYQDKCRAIWKAREEAELLKLAQDLGCPGNVQLAAFAKAMRDNVEEYKERLRKLEAEFWSLS